MADESTTTSPLSSQSDSGVGPVVVKVDSLPEPKPTASATAARKPFSATRSPPMWVALNPLVWLLWLLDFLVWLVFAILWPPAMYRFIRFTVFGNAGISSTSHVDMDTGHTFRTRRPMRNGKLDLKNHPFGKEHVTVHQVRIILHLRIENTISTK